MNSSINTGDIPNPCLRGHDVVPCYLCPRMVRIDGLLHHLQTFHGETFSSSNNNRTQASTPTTYAPPFVDPPSGSSSAAFGADNPDPASSMQNLIRTLFGIGWDDTAANSSPGQAGGTRTATEGMPPHSRREFHNNTRGPLSLTMSVVRDDGNGQQHVSTELTDENDRRFGSSGITMQTLLQEILSGLGESGPSSYDDNLQLIERMGGSQRVGIENADTVSSLVEGEERERLRNTGGACPICQCEWESVLSNPRGEEITAAADNHGDATSSEDDEDGDIETDEEADGTEEIEPPAEEGCRQRLTNGEHHLRRACCGHIFCDACIQAWFRMSNKCPVCRVNLTDMMSSATAPSTSVTTAR